MVEPIESLSTGRQDISVSPLLKRSCSLLRSRLYWGGALRDDREGEYCYNVLVLYFVTRKGGSN